MLLETPRLWLTAINANDLNIFHSILANQFVRGYLTDDLELLPQTSEEMLEESLRMFAQEGVGLWLLERKQNSEIDPEIVSSAKIDPEKIGLVGLWYFFGECQPQLIYALLPQWTGQGFATEAAQAVITCCFDFFGFNYLIASCDRPNLASQNLALRLGMVLVEEKIIEGKPIIFFSLSK